MLLRSPMRDRATGDGDCRLTGVELLPLRRLPLLEPIGELLEHPDTADADEFLLHLARGPQCLAVPVGHLAELKAAEVFAAPLDQPAEVPAHQGDTLLVGRSWPRIAGPQPRLKLSEEPRVQQGPAADGNAGAAGFFQHAGGLG